MKKIFLLIALSIFSIGMSQAQSKTPAKADADGKYALVISFGSRASGPDREGIKKLNELITATEKKYKKSLNYNIGHWGREGETDFSFDLAGLSKRQQKRFIKSVETEMKNYQVVSVGQKLAPPSERQKR